jgi:hypothetical protein
MLVYLIKIETLKRQRGGPTVQAWARPAYYYGMVSCHFLLARNSPNAVILDQCDSECHEWDCLCY